MAPRKPATPAEIAELLAKFLVSARVRKGTIFAPRQDFVDFVQRELHTTARNAREWVGDGAAGPDAPYKIVDTSYGAITLTLEPNTSGSLHRYAWKHFGAFDELTYHSAPLVDKHGVPTTDKDQCDEIGLEYVVPAATLVTIVEQAKENDVRLRKERAAAHLVKLEAAEAAHGEAIGLLRGLLFEAGISRTRHMRISHNPELTGGAIDMTTSVTLDLYSDQLESLAEVLKKLGVKPRYRRTARQQPEVADSVGS